MTQYCLVHLAAAAILPPFCYLKLSRCKKQQLNLAKHVLCQWSIAHTPSRIQLWLHSCCMQVKFLMLWFLKAVKNKSSYCWVYLALTFPTPSVHTWTAKLPCLIPLQSCPPPLFPPTLAYWDMLTAQNENDPCLCCSFWLNHSATSENFHPSLLSAIPEQYCIEQSHATNLASARHVALDVQKCYVHIQMKTERERWRHWEKLGGTPNPKQKATEPKERELHILTQLF